MTPLTLSQNQALLSDFDLTEVIDGIEYRSPAPSNRHQRISMALTKMLLTTIDYRLIIYAPHDVHINTKDRVQPDLSIYPSEQAIELFFLPQVVIEIISPTSIIHDRNRKFNLYETAGIQEYWLVDPETDSIEVYHLVEGTYQMHIRVIYTGEVTSFALPNLKFQIEEIFN